jgi:hypothetical protein
MLNSANIDYPYLINLESPTGIDDEDVEPCRVTMQVFATQTLPFMAQYGWPIKLFCCKPSVMRSFYKRISSDYNGH